MTELELLGLALLFVGSVGIVIAIILQGMSVQIADLSYYVAAYLHDMVYRPRFDTQKINWEIDNITTE